MQESHNRSRDDQGHDHWHYRNHQRGDFSPYDGRYPWTAYVVRSRFLIVAVQKRPLESRNVMMILPSRRCVVAIMRPPFRIVTSSGADIRCSHARLFTEDMLNRDLITFLDRRCRRVDEERCNHRKQDHCCHLAIE